MNQKTIVDFCIIEKIISFKKNIILLFKALH